MKTLTIAFCIALMGATSDSPIEALDAATIQALQSGEGHHLALAADANHYPGPRHVLDMRDHLGLSGAQVSAIQTIYDTMHREAVQLGAQVIAEERTLDTAFKSGSVSEPWLAEQTSRIAALEGQLRDVHLRAHLLTRAQLTKAQIDMYDRMREHKM